MKLQKGRRDVFEIGYVKLKNAVGGADTGLSLASNQKKRKLTRLDQGVLVPGEDMAASSV